MDNVSHKTPISVTTKALSAALCRPLDSSCLLRTTRRMVRLPIERALPLRAISLRFFCGGMRHAFHAGNAQERLRPRARHRSTATCVFGIALLLATGHAEGSAPISCIAFAPIGCLRRYIGVLFSWNGAFACLCAKAGDLRDARAAVSSPAPSFSFCHFSCANRPCGISRFVVMSCLCEEAAFESPPNRPSIIDSKLPSRENRIV